MPDPPADPPAPPAAADPPAVATIAKLPSFWPNDPSLWFAQVEAHFATRRITQQQTKFDHVVASLAPDVAMEVRDIILTPPPDDPYDNLKTALINRITLSEQQRLQQLLHAEELGDRRPSQLLRKMDQLLGEKDRPPFFRELFLQRLPPNVRMVLASTDEPNLHKLANLADKMMAASATQPGSIAAVGANAGITSEISQLREELHVAALKNTITARPDHRRRRSPSRERRGRDHSPHPLLSNPSSAPYCWYHHKFGAAARECSSPCSWSENSPARR